MVCIRPGGEEVLSPGRRVMDVCVSIAHCKKVVFTFLPFTFLPFYLSQYHSVTLSYNILYRSFFNQRGGRAIFLIDSFFRWIFDTENFNYRNFNVV